MSETYYASYAAWAEGFAIFAKYQPDAVWEVSAEHDIVYAGRCEVSDEDKARLGELHWEWDEHLECWYKFT